MPDQFLFNKNPLLITQLGLVVNWKGWNKETSDGRGSSLAGTMVNLFVVISEGTSLN